MAEPAFARTETGSVRYLQALRRHWLLILTLVVVAGAAALLTTYTATKRFTATADLLVRPLSPNDDTYRGFNSLFQQTLDGSSAVVTAARVVGSPEIKAPCEHRFPRFAQGAVVRVQPLGQADVIEISADFPTAGGASAAANAFATCAVHDRDVAYQKELAAQIAQIKARIKAIPADARAGNFQYAALQQSLATYSSSLGAANPTLSILTHAVTPAGAVWPRPKLALSAAVLVALLLGTAIAFLLEFLSPRISREEELQLQQRLPVLARVPRLPGSSGRSYLTGKTSLPPRAWKSYRVLRAVLANTGTSGGYPRTILVTSAMPGDGKTTTAINLAITLAAADLRVVLVDADVHRPMIASFFNVAAHRSGFTSLLSGDRDLRQILVDAPLEQGLQLVLAGQQLHGYVGLTSDRFAHALERLAAVADVVVIDSPPLPEVAEVLEMASAAEVVLLAVRLGRTRRDKLDEARELLARRDITPAGFVVTTRDRPEPETHYDYPGDVRYEMGNSVEFLEEKKAGRTAHGQSRRGTSAR